jgi:hypothetical protein
MIARRKPKSSTRDFIATPQQYRAFHEFPIPKEMIIRRINTSTRATERRNSYDITLSMVHFTFR